jgi:serine protease Do
LSYHIKDNLKILGGFNMEENNDFTVIDERTTNSNNNSPKQKKEKSKISVSKNIILPFASGILGCSLVLGTCLGVPQIKEKIFEATNTSLESTKETSSTLSTNNIVSGDLSASQISLNSYSDTAVYAAEKILPSIVGIEITYTVTSTYSFYGQPSQSTATATGSGIIISSDGYILTNNHVVDASTSSSSYSYYDLSEAQSVKVKLYDDDTTYDATIVGKDSQTDLAVLKIDATDLTAAEFADSDTVKVGEFAMAVGNPLGLDSSITCGVISALNREVTDSDGTAYTCIQTDAAINSGNSGGALVNSLGQVIGVNTLKLSGTGIEGIGFAIPINSTIDIVSDLIESGKVIRPYIGITGLTLDEDTAKKNNLVEGIYVKSVEDFSAAEVAGIKSGDVIIAVDGTEVKTMDELNEIKNTHKVGDTITITVNRNGEEKDFELTLKETP